MIQSEQKNPESSELNLIISSLQALIKLNQLQEKSYLTKQYQRSQLAHEKRLSLARFNLRKKIDFLDHYISEQTSQKNLSEKIKQFSKILLEELEQLSLNIIAMGCLRFRIMEDPETLTLKDKLLKTSSMLSQFLESLVLLLQEPKIKLNLQLLKRQIMVLEEAFHSAYPLDPEDEMMFSWDDEDDEDEAEQEENDDNNLIDVSYDEAHMALQAFIHTLKITYKDLESLVQALAPWRKI